MDPWRAITSGIGLVVVIICLAVGDQLLQIIGAVAIPINGVALVAAAVRARREH